jgi:hypothetical protein
MKCRGRPQSCNAQGRVPMLWAMVLFCQPGAGAFTTSCGTAVFRQQQQQPFCSSLVDELISLVQDDDTENSKILQLVTELEQSSYRVERPLAENDDNPTELAERSSSTQLLDDYDSIVADPATFYESLLGNYNVSHVISWQQVANLRNASFLPSQDRPVGGKWTRTKFWTVRRSMQHLLPPRNVTTAVTTETTGKSTLSPIITRVLPPLQRLVKLAAWTTKKTWPIPNKMLAAPLKIVPLPPWRRLWSFSQAKAQATEQISRVWSAVQSRQGTSSSQAFGSLDGTSNASADNDSPDHAVTPSERDLELTRQVIMRKRIRPPDRKPAPVRRVEPEMRPVETKSVAVVAPVEPAAVAQVVNIIILSTLRDWIRIHVMLRGDAYPDNNSTTTVRAEFDAPRIVVQARRRQAAALTLLNLAMGPTSSVVLDTPYCDDRVRLGTGGKGSRFVFVRLPATDVESQEWIRLYQQAPLRQWKVLTLLCANTVMLGWWCTTTTNILARTLVSAVTAASAVLTVGTALSTGGIQN